MKTQEHWPAARVEFIDVAKLVPYARNARMHSPEQVRAIAASITEWGWTNPVLLDEHDGLIAGHGRLLAAELLRIKQVPAMRAVGWSEAQKRAYVIADNQLALAATWDERMLKVELQELADAEFKLELLGFPALELGALLASTDDLAAHEDGPAPAPPLNPVSKLGDLWTLGTHRLLCGDSTNAADVSTLLAGAVPLLMVTDPPYGVEYDPAWRNAAGASSTARTGKVLNDDRVDWSAAWKLFPGDIGYVWHSALYADEVTRSLSASGFERRSQIIWSKSRFALSRGAYHWQHEPCYYGLRDKAALAALTDDDRAAMRQELEDVLAGRVDFSADYEPSWYGLRRGRTARWIGGRKQSTLWDIAVTDDGDKSTHGTQKPLECMGRPMRNHDTPSVYEPFAGSGSTLIAADLLKRQCFAMELSPAYVDVVIERWVRRGGKALLGEKPFEAVRAERHAPPAAVAP